MPAGAAPPFPMATTRPQSNINCDDLVASAIAEALDACYRDIEFDGISYALRIPFGENGERRDDEGYSQIVFGGGKADPARLWEAVEGLLDSEDFRRYADELGKPGSKTLVFELAARRWRVDLDASLADRIRAGDYPGDRSTVYVLHERSGLDPSSIYDYLYCVGSLGLDCAGFVWSVERSVGRALGLDLDASFAADYGKTAAEWPLWAGIWLFDPANGRCRDVGDRFADLKPGDIILFRGREGAFRHSAVIASIDRGQGLLRYAQCTDWAPRAERGVHESLIRFDPRDPEARLGDESSVWTQKILPAFEGEPGLVYWRTDGDRWRCRWERGVSLVVRLGALR